MTEFTAEHINKEQLPLVIKPKKKGIKKQDFWELLKSDGDQLRKQLLTYGGLLFRDFPIENEDDFSSVIDHLHLGKYINYIGGDSPRDKIKGGVYTSTEAPPSIKIPLHNELSFVKNHPKHIYFYCHIAPEQGGETIVGDARKVLKAVDPDVRKRFSEKGLKYVSCYYRDSALMNMLNRFQRSHRSWLDVFEVNDKNEVERLCRENEFAYQWNQHDWLKISQTRPATMKHPETGEEVWFNQVHLYDFNPRLLGMWRYVAAKMFYCRDHMKLHEVFFSDHSQIPRKDLYHVLDVLDANTIYFPWQKGDVLVLDNVLAMHGRAVFNGKRRILTAMTG
ncbi:MAG: TauD/TfdA family dioxygenase [Verrucomicrobia bacterium]|nr:TauD/TfdA family dioxygenase [Verrucomicrobiota bacterium]